MSAELLDKGACPEGVHIGGGLQGGQGLQQHLELARLQLQLLQGVICCECQAHRSQMAHDFAVRKVC